MRLSIIIPTLNEAADIRQTLLALQPLRGEGHQVVVADGGSEDNTVALCLPLADRVIVAPRGRGRQMNAGARHAAGSVLLFLHADTVLPPDAACLVVEGLEREGRSWGRFDVRLSGRHPLLRVVELMMNRRSRLTGVCTGDQTLFVRRPVFEEIGGFPEIDLMEDLALCRTLRRRGPPLCLAQPVLTSSRRWDRNGVLRTILLMWSLRLAYAVGVDPRRLALRYDSQASR
jgi:rSAM/selenodomain-associated transferase 2